MLSAVLAVLRAQAYEWQRLLTGVFCSVGRLDEEVDRLADTHTSAMVVVACAELSCVQPGCVLSPAGVETIHPVGSMSDYEKEIMTSMKPELLSSIEKGVNFVKNN